MAAGNARSVNINFEHPSTGSRDGLVAFMEALTTAVRAEWSDGTVTITAPRIEPMSSP